MKLTATVDEVRALLALAGSGHGRKRSASKRHREPRPLRASRQLLDRYERLLAAGREPAIVAIVRGACSGCNLRLPTMVELQTRRSVAVHTCPHCQRMLYVPDLLREADEPGQTLADAAAVGPSRS